MVERAVLEDVDLDAGEDPERRQLLVERGDVVELLLEPLLLSPWAIVRRGEWSVSTMYSWPRPRAVRAIASIVAPPSLHTAVQVAVALQRGQIPSALVGHLTWVSASIFSR